MQVRSLQRRLMALGEEQRRRWQELEIETDARETESRDAGACALQQVPPT
jgi:hypothetical protein